jgi:hypothetical protein
MCRGVDAVKQRPRFGGIEHRGLSGRDDVARPAHSVRRVDRHDLAIDQPVKQVAQRREPLLDRGRGEFAGRSLDPCADVHRLYVGDRQHSDVRALGQRFLCGAVVGPPRVRIADVGREEFEEAHAGRSDERWLVRCADAAGHARIDSPVSSTVLRGTPTPESDSTTAEIKWPKVIKEAVIEWYHKARRWNAAKEIAGRYGGTLGNSPCVFSNALSSIFRTGVPAGSIRPMSTSPLRPGLAARSLPAGRNP